MLSTLAYYITMDLRNFYNVSNATEHTICVNDSQYIRHVCT